MVFSSLKSSCWYICYYIPLLIDRSLQHHKAAVKQTSECQQTSADERTIQTCFRGAHQQLLLLFLLLTRYTAASDSCFRSCLGHVPAHQCGCPPNPQNPYVQHRWHAIGQNPVQFHHHPSLQQISVSHISVLSPSAFYKRTLSKTPSHRNPV